MLVYRFITRVVDREIHQIIDLYRKAGWWKEPEDGPDRLKRIISGSHCFLAVKSEERIIGMGRAISDRASDAYIQDVTVDPDFRGRGIGTQLVADIVSRLEKDGLAWIGLIAEKNSNAFYEPLGFKPMDRSVPMLRLSI